ncbi:MAG: hypothetical protein M3447_01245 [Acidobacteriota bacterium]|nr:hypothetical protein [Acidobacteriota bacterium]
MSAQPETWRVSTIEGVFEADLETLRQWILEGCVQPTDKVTKGNMNWIEAGKAPMLRAAFAGERVPISVPTVPAVVEVFPEVATAAPRVNEVSAETHSPNLATADFATPDFAPSVFPDEGGSPDFCQNHPHTPTKYICRACVKGSCEECARFVANSKIPLCPICGDLCKVYAAEKSKVQREQFQESGFGFVDFARALRYPLQHKVALCFGAALYGLMLLAGFRGRIVASVIMFGCISHVISNVAWGRLHKSFMPDFSEFSVWDDVAVPIALGIGITIVTWGPAIVLILALVFGLVSSGPSTENALQPAGADSEQLKEGDFDTLLDPNADHAKQVEASKKLNQLRPGHEIGKEAERSKTELNDPTAELKMLFGYLRAPILLVLLLLLAIGWGIFYYPMALAVAGYTQTFGSVINPLVGIDTIKRMGATYFKAFGLVLMVQIVGGIIGIIVAIILSPFALPFVGNLPAMFVDGSLTFYFNLVIACVLGLSLFKCADRLGIDVE